MSKIFSGTPEIGGYFKASSDKVTKIKIARAGGGDDGEVGAGFLVSSYSLNWSRTVTFNRALNVSKSYITESAASGTLQLTGLVGKLDDFKALFGDDTDNLCKPVSITIDLSGSYIDCTSGIKAGQSLVCTNCISQMLNLSGNANSGYIQDEGTITFAIGGVEIK